MEEKIQFAHLADLHLGAYREKKLTFLNYITFKLAIDKIIEKNVEFVLFAGDIFNNAMPPIELVSQVTNQFMRLKKVNIPIFVIGGSHDYSNTGKSFLNLLEIAGVFEDVGKVQYIDEQTVKLKFANHKNVTISGILGKKNGLDKNIYKNLTTQTLDQNNLNIFMFHTTLNDFKPEFMKNVKTEVIKSYLPEGFDYYAGGHIHTFMKGNYSTGILSYPGPLFPNNFSELKRETPSFNLCEFDFETRETEIQRVHLNTYEKEYIKIHIDTLNPVDAKLKIESSLEKIDPTDKIILLEIYGVVEGKILDIKLNKILSNLYDRGAYIILKNTYKLTSSKVDISEYAEIEDTNQIEIQIINETFEKLKTFSNGKQIMKELLNLDFSKLEDEKVAQYEERILTAMKEGLKELKTED